MATCLSPWDAATVSGGQAVSGGLVGPLGIHSLSAGEGGRMRLVRVRKTPTAALADRCRGRHGVEQAYSVVGLPLAVSVSRAMRPCRGVP